MKKMLIAFLALNNFQALLGSNVAPGVFKFTTEDDLETNDQSCLVVLNHVPNQNLENNGGWNFFFTRVAGTEEVPTYTMYTSRKLNPDYVSGQNDQYIPANFATAQDAVDAYETGDYERSI